MRRMKAWFTRSSGRFTEVKTSGLHTSTGRSMLALWITVYTYASTHVLVGSFRPCSVHPGFVAGAVLKPQAPPQSLRIIMRSLLQY